MLCTVKLARQHWKVYSTKPPNGCQRLKIPLNHHQALSDAHACTEIILLAQGARLTNAYYRCLGIDGYHRPIIIQQFIEPAVLGFAFEF
jgi:DNA polymerase III epsilon subunit-like protein